MPYHYPSSIASPIGVAGNGRYYMNSLSGVPTGYVISNGSLANTSHTFTLNWYEPNYNFSGTYTSTGTLQLTFSVVNMNMSVVAAAQRLDSTGTLLNVGTDSAITAISASPIIINNLSFSAWTNASCSDILRLRLTFVNGAMSTQSVTMTVNSPDTYLNSPVPFGDPGNSGCAQEGNTPILVFRT